MDSADINGFRIYVGLNNDTRSVCNPNSTTIVGGATNDFDCEFLGQDAVVVSEKRCAG